MSQEIKDFQCATAERILHIYKNLGHRRVLLAEFNLQMQQNSD